MSFEELHRWIAPLGWALLHFCWQGLAVALAAWASMTVARGSRARYAIGCIAMIAMIALPIATLDWIGADPMPPKVTVDAAPRLAGEPARRLASEERRAISPVKREVRALRERLDGVAPAIVTTWLAGVAIGATWHLVGLAQLRRLRRGANAVVDPIWLTRVRTLSTRLNVRRRVALLVTDRIDCPAVVGAIRPAILWPLAAMSGLTLAQVEALLAHELAHVRRHDYAINLLQTLVETLLFYHPAVWWLSRRVRREREHCCDDLAADVIGNRAAYAGALAAMETLRSMTPSLAVSARGGSLMTRVQRLLNPAPAGRFSPIGLWLIVTTLALVGVFACKPREPSTIATATTKPATHEFDDRIAVGDLLRVSVFDLTGPGVETALLKRVESDGTISMPYIDQPLQVGGHRPSEAERSIAACYRDASVISQPNVAVLVVQGADGRAIPAGLFAPEPVRPLTADVPSDPSELRRTIADLTTQVQKLQRDAAASLTDGGRIAVDPSLRRIEASLDQAALERKVAIDTFGSNSSQVKAADEKLATLAAQLRQAVAERNSPRFKIQELQAQRQQLVDALAAATREHGESSDDAFTVRDAISQLDVQIAGATGLIGEYYLTGAVARPGVYSLTARRITLMQAMISAGCAAPAVPDDDPSHDFGIDVVRRDVADGRETRTRYRWSDVTHGKLGTFYLMPNDQVIVGGGSATTEPTTAPSSAAPPMTPRAFASIRDASIRDAVSLTLAARAPTLSPFEAAMLGSTVTGDAFGSRVVGREALRRAAQIDRIVFDPLASLRALESAGRLPPAQAVGRDGMSIVGPKPFVTPIPTIRPSANAADEAPVTASLDGLHVDRIYEIDRD